MTVPSLALVILDGWGLAPSRPGQRDLARRDAGLRRALGDATRTPRSPPQGRDVGLPDGQMGNSEVGHLNLGAGAIVKQDLARIDDAIADGSFFENEALLAACDAARRSPRGRLHLLGLVSDGGVHSGWEHIEAMIELAAQRGRARRRLPRLHRRPRHAAARRARATCDELERWLRHAGRIATVGGRYCAMDRDTRWERTKRAYDAIVHARRPARATSAAEAIEARLRARARPTSSSSRR